MRFTTYEEALELFGTPDAPGPFKETFDTVMQLNIEQGVADEALVYEEQVDASLLVESLRGTHPLRHTSHRCGGGGRRGAASPPSPGVD